MTKENNVLKKSEKQEIVSDVKEAFDKAKGNSKMFYNKNGERKLSIVIPTIIVVLFISFGIIYWYFSSNPKTIFIRSVNLAFDNLSNSIIDSTSSLSGTIDVNYETFTGNMDKYDFKIDYILNEKNNISNGVIKDNISSEMNFYKGDKTYLFIPELYDKYIYLGSSNFNYNSDYIKNIIKSLNLAFLDSINGYKISNSKVSLKDGKLKHARKTSLSLKNDDIKLVLDKIYEYLKNDDKFMESYKNVFNNNLDTKVKNIFQNSDSIIFNIYTSGLDDSILKLELVETENNRLNTLSITTLAKSKYEILIDNTITGKKMKYLVSANTSDSGFEYNIDVKREKMGSKELDMNIKLNGIDGNTKKIKKESMDDVLDYNMLSNEEKQRVDNKLVPFQSFIKELTEK